MPGDYVQLTINHQSQYLSIKLHDNALSSRIKSVGDALRGDIVSFSRDSRKRLIDTQAKIDKRKAFKIGRPKFVTLTYQSDMMDFQRAKRDLKVFVQRVRREWSKATIIWKMELQERGAIHFHLMVYNTLWWNIETWQKAWDEIAGQETKNSLDIEQIRSIEGVMYYTAKYMTKEQEYEDTTVEGVVDNSIPYGMCCENAPELRAPAGLGLSIPHKRPGGTGRWWGVWGRKHAPFGDEYSQYLILPRWLYKCAVAAIGHEYAKCWQSFTILSGLNKLHMWRFFAKIKPYLAAIERVQRERDGARRFRRCMMVQD